MKSIKEIDNTLCDFYIVDVEVRPNDPFSNPLTVGTKNYKGITVEDIHSILRDIVSKVKEEVRIEGHIEDIVESCDTLMKYSVINEKTGYMREICSHIYGINK